MGLVKCLKPGLSVLPIPYGGSVSVTHFLGDWRSGLEHQDLQRRQGDATLPLPNVSEKPISPGLCPKLPTHLKPFHPSTPFNKVDPLYCFHTF